MRIIDKEKTGRLFLIVTILVTSFLISSVSAQEIQKPWENFPDFSDPNLEVNERFERAKMAILQTLEVIISENSRDIDMLRKYAESVRDYSQESPSTGASYIGRGYTVDGQLIIFITSSDMALFLDTIKKLDSQDLYTLWKTSLLREAAGLMMMEQDKILHIELGKRATQLIKKQEELIGQKLGGLDEQQPFFSSQGIQEEIFDPVAYHLAQNIAEAFRKYLAVELFMQSDAYSAERALESIHKAQDLSQDASQLAEKIVQGSRAVIWAEGNLDKLIQSHLATYAASYFTKTFTIEAPFDYIIVYYFMLEAYRFVVSKGAEGLDPSAYKKATYEESIARFPHAELESSAKLIKPQVLEHLKEIDSILPESQKFFAELEYHSTA